MRTGGTQFHAWALFVVASCIAPVRASPPSNIYTTTSVQSNGQISVGCSADIKRILRIDNPLLKSATTTWSASGQASGIGTSWVSPYIRLAPYYYYAAPVQVGGYIGGWDGGVTGSVWGTGTIDLSTTYYIMEFIASCDYMPNSVFNDPSRTPTSGPSGGLSVTMVGTCVTGATMYNNECRWCCPAGQYNTVSGTKDCAGCPVNSYSTGCAMTSACTACPTYYISPVNTTSLAGCVINCPVGMYITGATCTQCPAGTYSNVVNASTNATCQTCPTGKYSVAGSSNCSDCPAGTYSDVNGTRSAAACTSCPAGTSSGTLGATSIDTCIACSPGSSAVARSPSCALCAAGFYEELSGQGSCDPCPGGTYSTAVGSDTATVCTPCAIGSYSNPGSSVCSLCARGKYAMDTGMPECTMCPGGTYSTVLGSTTLDNCLNCSVDTYSLPASTSCTTCIPGTYADVASPICSPCPLGTFSCKNNVPVLTNLSVVDVANASFATYHTCAIVTGGLVKCWGRNTYGQLGYGDTANRLSPPSTVVNLGTGVTAKQLYTGGSHTCAILANDTIKCWGLNNYGQLGYGDSTYRYSPPLTTVNIGTGVVPRSMCLGDSYTCVLSTAGGIKCWGQNDQGQLGFGSTANTYTAPATGFVEIGSDFVPVDVACGKQVTCATSVEGQLRCWGYSGYGEFSMGSNSYQIYSPPSFNITLPTGLTVKKISLGYLTVCIVGSDDKGRCWGYNSYGQLGNQGTSSVYYIPTTATSASPVTYPNITQIALGQNHACWLTSAGMVQCWGYNLYGQLGYGTTTNRLYPQGYVTLRNLTKKVYVGYDHTCALLVDGTLQCWGYNSFGELGLAHTNNVGVASTDLTNITAPVDVNTYVVNSTCAVQSIGTGCESCRSGSFSAVQGKIVCDSCIAGSYSTDVGAVNDSVCVACPAGTYSGSPGGASLSACIPCPAGRYSTAVGAISNATCLPCPGGTYSDTPGSSQCSQCLPGSGPNAPEPTCTPTVASSSSTITEMVMGNYADHVCAIYTGGRMKCWGGNAYGQLGYNDTVQRTSVPSDFINFPGGLTVKAASINMYTTCAIMNNSQLLCWGYNGNGQLGYGDTTNRVAPPSTFVNFGAGVWVKAVSVGYFHVCVITNDNFVRCWGTNNYGQLGYGDTTYRYAPPSYSVNMGGDIAMQIGCGTSYCCFVTGFGSTKCWGLNDQGQLNMGSNTNYNVPVMNSNSFDIKKLVVGTYSACVLTVRNYISCWGSNSGYVLGTTSVGSMTYRAYGVSPSEVAVGVSLGNQFGCFVQMAGDVQCWGTGTSGQLGNGVTSSSSSVPITALLGTGVKATKVYAGSQSACAILTTGGVKCWGANANGQLGYGNTIPKDSVALMGNNLPTVNFGSVNYTIPCTLPTGASACLTCPMGSYAWPGDKACNLCPAGKYSQELGANSSDTCLNCPVGTYSNPGSSGCTPCRAGTYADQEGTATCKLCSAGLYSSEVGANTSDTCVPCPLGTYSQTPGIGSVGLCVGCPTGTYSDVTGIDNVTKCTPCWAGTYSTAVGAPANDTCVPCGLGKYSSKVGANNATTCVACPVGTYADVAGLAQCTKCPAGMFSTAVGANTIDTCTNCAIDTYSSPGSSACTGCLAGKYSATGSPACSDCDAGTYACKSYVPFVQTLVVESVAVGNTNTYHSCVVVTGGNVKCWGTGTSYQLGYGDATNRITPPATFVNLGAGVTAKSVYVSLSGSCAILTTLDIKCWGTNAYGEMGYGDGSARASPPAAVVNIGAGVKAKDMCMGQYFTCMVSTTGGVKCWGRNDYGQLGYKDTTQRNSPASTFVDMGTNVTVEQIVCGQSFVCARTTEGRVKCWGYNGNGQLGYLNGDSQYTAPPAGYVNFGPGVFARKLAAGEAHACILTTTNSVRCWGTSSYGLLAGSSRYTSIVAASPYANPNVTDIVSGRYHSCWLLNTSEVQCWGENSGGQLGYGDKTTRTTISGIVDVGNATKMLMLGFQSTCAVLMDGSLKCWGANAYYELGIGSNVAIGDGPNEMGSALQFTNLGTNVVNTTCAIGNSPSNGCQACPAGTYASFPGSSTCVPCPKGTYSTATGQVSNATCLPCAAGTYADVVGSTSCTSCPAGTVSTTVAATSNSTCVPCPGVTYSASAGSTQCDTCPAGSSSNSAEKTCNATFVPSTQLKIVRMSSGSMAHSTCAILRDGSAKCWGRNDFGQLGYNDTVQRTSVPNEFVNFGTPGLGVQDIGMADMHACALMTNGSVKCWGNTANGRLGIGSTSLSKIMCPADSPFVDLGAGVTAKKLVVAQMHACVITNSDDVKCWGYNGYGNLGYGDVSDKLAPPAAVVNLGTYDGQTAKAVDLVLGGYNLFHTCVITDASRVLCWGYNDMGQLGDGSTSQRNSPTSVANQVTSASKICAGYRYTCALRTSNGLSCWGVNDYYQYGKTSPASHSYAFGYYTDYTAPSEVLQIGCGQFTTCWLVSSGDVQCWGGGPQGQLGTGSTSNTNVPTTISLGTGLKASALYMGVLHICVLLTTEDAKCWGYGAYGQLGIGSTVSIGDSANEMGNLLAYVAIGNTSNATVQTCTGGAGGTGCSTCRAGTYSVGGTCTPCAAGMYSTAVGATTSDVCQICPIGTFSAAGSSACTTCPAGTYADQPGTQNACTKCAAGMYSAATGATSISTCTACVAGTYSPNAGAVDVSACASCPIGTYAALPGSAACTACPAGTYSNVTGASSSSTCQLCAMGSYSTVAASAACTKCVAGTYLPFTGGNASAQCTNCPAGSYSLAGSGNCTMCVAGTYSTTVAATSSATCIACIAGRYSSTLGANSSAYCQRCPAGTYSAVVGAGSLSTCASCPADTYSSYTGASSNATCVPCDAGKYSAAGASACASCSAGTFACKNVQWQISTSASYLSSGFAAQHTCIILPDGGLRCWGRNDVGQLGYGDTNSRTSPPATNVSLGTGVMAKKVFTALQWTCVLTTTNQTKCWGLNNYGQHGYNDVTQRTSPSASFVNFGTGITVQDMCIGTTHGCAIVSTGGLRCWGGNDYGQLGYGDTTSRYAPPATDVNLGSGVAAKQVVCGVYSTCILSTTNQVKCWGYNSNGNLGYGDTTQRSSPSASFINLGSGVTAKKLSHGDYFVCFVTGDDRAKCWGSDTAYDGKLGYGWTTGISSPQSSGILSSTPYGTSYTAVDIKAGRSHTCMLLTTGEVQCWGYNNYGALGVADNAGRAEPTTIASLGTGKFAVSIDVYDGFSCALFDDSTMKCWGNNNYGQLGYGNNNYMGTLASNIGNNLPTVNLGSTSYNNTCPAGVSTEPSVCSVCPAGTYSGPQSSSCTACSAGTSSLAGSSVCTNCSAGYFSCKTLPVTSALPVKNISGGLSSHMCAIGSDANLRCWGLNNYGQLGYGDTTIRYSPGPVVNVGTGVVPLQVVTGADFTCLLSTAGQVKCWGRNDYGQLGYGDNLDKTSPPSTFLNFGTGAVVQQISSGSQHSCAVLTTGIVQCWGFGGYGEIGVNSLSNWNSPVSTSSLGSGVLAKQVACGQYFTCIISTTNDVKCWGSNGNGQLGYGDIAQRMTPPATFVSLGTGITAKKISCGSFHVCVVTSNDKAKCWGGNSNGQVGDGGTTDVKSPQASFISGTPYASPVVVNIVAGGAHTCWHLNTSEVQCWGSGANGRLGYGNTTSYYPPTGIISLATGKIIRTLQVFGLYQCVIYTDETLQCWGYNSGGGLGTGLSTSIGDKPNQMGDNIPYVVAGTQVNNVPCAVQSTGAACQACPAGMTSGNGSSVCTNCSIATYAPVAGSPTCLACPPNTNSSEPGSSVCKALNSNCTAGYSGPAGSANCTICPAGTFSKDQAVSCPACPRNAYSMFPGSSNCTECPKPGYGTLIPYATNDSVCSPLVDRNGSAPCAAGTFTVNSTHCIQCPDGMASGVVGASSYSTCATCPAGENIFALFRFFTPKPDG